MKVLKIYFFFISTFIFSCTQTSNPLCDLTGKKTGLFRGVSINDSPEEVKIEEGKLEALVINEKYTLVYEYKYPKINTEIKYLFDDRGLYKIETLGRCSSQKVRDKLFNDLLLYYDTLYTESYSNGKNAKLTNQEIILTINKLDASSEINIIFETNG